MVIAFIAFGVLFGATAAGFTILSGGSILLALAAYSGVGTLAALAMIFFMLFFSESDAQASEWSEKQKSANTVSA